VVLGKLNAHVHGLLVSGFAPFGHFVQLTPVADDSGLIATENAAHPSLLEKVHAAVPVDPDDICDL